MTVVQPQNTESRKTGIIILHPCSDIAEHGPSMAHNITKRDSLTGPLDPCSDLLESTAKDQCLPTPAVLLKQGEDVHKLLGFFRTLTGVRVLPWCI